MNSGNTEYIALLKTDFKKSGWCWYTCNQKIELNGHERALVQYSMPENSRSSEGKMIGQQNFICIEFFFQMLKQQQYPISKFLGL